MFLFLRDCYKSANKWTSSGNSSNAFRECRCTSKDQVRLGQTSLFACVCVLYEGEAFHVLMLLCFALEYILLELVHTFVFFILKNGPCHALSTLCTADLWSEHIPAPPRDHPFISDHVQLERHQCGEIPCGHSKRLHQEQVDASSVNTRLMTSDIKNSSSVFAYSRIWFWSIL